MLRFAPSQTRDMNIADLRIAIFNYILSKQLNEDLVIRIDDTNKEKNIEGKDKEILEILNLFSIEYKNGLHQSDSLKYHQKLAMQLMTQKKAFACFCGEEKLKELKEKAKKEGKQYYYDGFCETLSDETVLNTNAPFTVRIKRDENNLDLDSFNILRHDKTPTSNYACSLDDMLMNISTVIEEEKNILDSEKQKYIRSLLSYDKEIKYIYLPSISNIDEINSVKALIEDGFLPSAIANYLVLLGNETPNEIFTLEEAIKWFNIDNISKETVKFDLEKLKDINKKHLEIIDEMRLSKILGFADADIGKLGKLFLNEVNTINEIKEKVELIFAPKTQNFENLDILKECLIKAPYFENFDDFKKYIKENSSLKDNELFKPLNYILTGNENTTNITDIYPLIKNYLGEIIK